MPLPERHVSARRKEAQNKFSCKDAATASQHAEKKTQASSAKRGKLDQTLCANKDLNKLTAFSLPSSQIA